MALPPLTVPKLFPVEQLCGPLLVRSEANYVLSIYLSLQNALTLVASKRERESERESNKWVVLKMDGWEKRIQREKAKLR